MDWTRRKTIITALFICGIVLLIGLAAASFALGWRTLVLNNRIADLNVADEQAHALLQAVVDAETGVRGFALTADPDYLGSYYSGIERAKELVAAAAKNPLLSNVASPQGASLPDLIAERRERMRLAIDAVQAGGGQAALALPNAGAGKQVMDEIRETMDALNDRLEGQRERLSAELAITAQGLSMLLVGCIGLAILLSVAQFHLFRREITHRGAIEITLQQRHREIALISQLADSLHASNSRDESYAVIEAFARDVLAGTSGRLYVYNNSRDQLLGDVRWGDLSSEAETSDRFAPDDCWALRRGKVHISSTASGQVQCRHVPAEPPRSYMCVPISARGQTSGSLYLQSPDTDPERAFEQVKRVALNVADQLSLALVSIELRERLQNLAIRDPLTELYNRRYLDDALGRELLLAERHDAKLCVLMLDLDHFKQVNDSFGHAAGDEILKHVAYYLTAALRRSDIVCRYGGEELIAVLPDCGLEEAAQKAEAIRRGIKSLTLRTAGFELPPITVSIGVACFPDSTTEKTELLSLTDQALYRAKRQGRDRVVVAEPVVQQPDETATHSQEA